MPNRNRVQGFTLAEVLIALLVMSIGLLGFAALQTLNIRNNHSAYMRTQATLLAYDMIDRMRANVAAANAGNYLTTYGTAPAGTVNCETASCNALNMAVFDRNQWKCTLGRWNSDSVCANTLNIVGRLPNGDGQVTQNSDDIYTVSVRWDDRDNNTMTLGISTTL
jgi:type IV pilus assembly protein PilV